MIANKSDVKTHTRRNYVTNVELETVNKLIELAVDENKPFEVFDGVLLDSYIIYDAENIQIGKIKPRKYIILREKYLNCWSSTIEMTMTDDENMIREMKKIFDN